MGAPAKSLIDLLNEHYSESKSGEFDVFLVNGAESKIVGKFKPWPEPGDEAIAIEGTHNRVAVVSLAAVSHIGAHVRGRAVMI